MMMTTTSKEKDISPEETNADTSKQQLQPQQLLQQQQEHQQHQEQLRQHQPEQQNEEDLIQAAKPRPNPPPKRLNQQTNPESDSLVRMIFSEQRLQV